MSDYPNERDCEHGHKRGKCAACDDAQEIAELRAALAAHVELRNRLVKFRPALKELHDVYTFAFVHNWKSSWPLDADNLEAIIARAEALAATKET